MSFNRKRAKKLILVTLAYSGFILYKNALDKLNPINMISKHGEHTHLGQVKTANHLMTHY